MKGFTKSKLGGEITVEVIRTGDTMLALVTATGILRETSCGFEPLTAHGRSHRSTGDDFDFNIGANIATAKALESLASQIRKDAAGLVKHRANMKEQRSRQFAKRAGGTAQRVSRQLQRAAGGGRNAG